MTTTHDHDTLPVKPADLDPSMVIVGECGGLSAIFEAPEESNVLPGHYLVTTEHGNLYLDGDLTVDILVSP
jgi:hypothetical protein